MNRTLYVKDEDDDLWNEAQEVLKARNISVSAFCTKKLKEFMDREKAKASK